MRVARFALNTQQRYMGLASRCKSSHANDPRAFRSQALLMSAVRCKECYSAADFLALDLYNIVIGSDKICSL